MRRIGAAALLILAGCSSDAPGPSVVALPTGADVVLTDKVVGVRPEGGIVRLDAGTLARVLDDPRDFRKVGIPEDDPEGPPGFSDVIATYPDPRTAERHVKLSPLDGPHRGAAVLVPRKAIRRVEK